MIDLFSLLRPPLVMKTIYISLEAYCSVFLAVTLVFMLLKADRRQRSSRYLVASMACGILILLFDSLGVHYEFSSRPNASVLVELFNLIVFILYYGVLAGLCVCMLAFFRQRVEIARWLTLAMIGMCVASVILVLVLQNFKLLFYINESGRYQRGPLYFLASGLTGFVLVLQIWAIHAYRQSFNSRERLALGLFAALPILAMVLQGVIYGLPLMGVAMTLSTLILYSAIQAEQSRQLQKRETELNSDRVAIMLSQIQPHFLYNALTAIAMLCDVSPEKAKKAIVEFSFYLRGNMDSLKQKRLIPFEKELKHTEVYVELERMRFGDELNVEYDIQCRSFVMPALTMQPIVENAVKYGIGQKEDGGTVTIATRETALDFRIIVSDNGVGYDLSKPQYDGRTHIGTENVQKRLWAQCGGRLEIHSVRGEGTVAKIIIPKKGENAL